MKLLQDIPAYYASRLAFGFFDDFVEYVTGDLWTLVATDSGTAVVGDAAGGILTLTCSDGTVADNDEIYLKTTKEVFKIASDKPLFFETRLQFAEAATDDANVGAGFASAVAANSLQDNGAGPAADYSGAQFFTVDGNVNWWVEFSIGTTQNTVELTAANSADKTAHVAGSASYQKLSILVQPTTSALCDVHFYIDDELVYSMKDQTYTNATEMNAYVGAKNGGSSGEAVAVDYVAAYQQR